MDDTTRIRTMMVKILLVLTMILMAKADLENFVTREEFEEVLSIVKELKTENSLLKAEVSELKATDDELQCKASEIVSDVSFLKDPPYYHLCVYQHGTDIDKSNIWFEKELYFTCNNCSQANFDLDSGVYTNGWPGTYTVTWSLMAGDNAGEPYVRILLKKNDQIIEESEHVSYYTGSSGYVTDQGINIY